MCKYILTEPFCFLGAFWAFQRPRVVLRSYLAILSNSIIFQQSYCFHHRCCSECVEEVTVAAILVCFPKTAHCCCQLFDWKYLDWMVAAAYLDGDWQARQSALVHSFEGEADTAAVTFCLKYCLYSPVAAADMTVSVGVSTWELFRLPARYPEKDAFGG